MWAQWFNKMSNKYYLYSIYWDNVFVNSYKTGRTDYEQLAKEYIAQFAPVGTYVFDCAWNLQYMILCPTKLTKETLNKFCLEHKIEEDKIDIQEFKRISNFVITEKDIENFAGGADSKPLVS